MASPRSASSRRVTPSPSTRRFTLAQANSALPYVKRVVADIVRTHEVASRLQTRVESLEPGKERTRFTRDLQLSTERLDELHGELTTVGVELKDPSTGLVDFVGRHTGHDVYLCWRLGEDKITHFHEIDAGFAGRQPVASLDERE